MTSGRHQRESRGRPLGGGSRAEPVGGEGAAPRSLTVDLGSLGGPLVGSEVSGVVTSGQTGTASDPAGRAASSGGL